MQELARPTTPTPSTQSFIMPTSTVKSGPSIKELIHDPVPTASQPAVVASPVSTPVPAEQETAVVSPAEPENSAASVDVQNIGQDTIVSEGPSATVVDVPDVEPEAIVTEDLVAAPAEIPNVESESQYISDIQEDKQGEEMTEEPADVSASASFDTDDDLDEEEDDLLPHDAVEEDFLPVEDIPTQVPESAVVDDEQVVKRPPANPEDDPETFRRFWEAMVEAIFSDIPTLHEPLKHYYPVRKENTLIVSVKNDIQENDFALRKNQVMIYLRENWDESLDEIEVKLDLAKEVKKYILDDNDKLNALREQNPDLADFVRGLNLRIKN